MALVPMEYDDGNFTEVTITPNSSYIDQNYSKCYSNGKICIVSLCFHLNAAITAVTTNMYTGLPSNSNQNYGVTASSSKTAARMRILSGALQFEDAQNTGWYDGNIVYVI